MADNKIALITGAAGFIGSHTVHEFVRNGWFVYAVVHRKKSAALCELQEQGRINILQADLSDLDDVARLFGNLPTSPDAVVHCAGRASDTGWASEFRKANFDSVKNLTAFVKQYDIEKFVFVSTTDVYGIRDFNGETEEQLNYDPHPRNNYPKFKILAEKWIKSSLPPRQWCILRPAAAWGPDDPTFTKRLHDFFAWSPFIVHFGKWKGQNRWPAVHVDTVAGANFLAAVNPRAAGEAINVIDAKRVTADEFYRMIIRTYFPDKTFRPLNLPYWAGWCFAAPVSIISHILNQRNPFADPSLYALKSVSSNLDFSGEKMRQLFELSSLK